MQSSSLYIFVYVCIFTFLSIHKMYIYVYMYMIYIYLCTYVYVCIYIYIYIYIYICTCVIHRVALVMVPQRLHLQVGSHTNVLAGGQAIRFVAFHSVNHFVKVTSHNSHGCCIIGVSPKVQYDMICLYDYVIKTVSLSHCCGQHARVF